MQKIGPNGVGKYAVTTLEGRSRMKKKNKTSEGRIGQE